MDDIESLSKRRDSLYEYYTKRQNSKKLVFLGIYGFLAGFCTLGRLLDYAFARMTGGEVAVYLFFLVTGLYALWYAWRDEKYLAKVLQEVLELDEKIYNRDWKK